MQRATFYQSGDAATEPHPKKKGGSLKRECVLVYLSYIDCQSMMVKLAPIWLPCLIRGALQKKDLTMRYVYSLGHALPAGELGYGSTSNLNSIEEKKNIDNSN